jgi:hypothetical protein
MWREQALVPGGQPAGGEDRDEETAHFQPVKRAGHRQVLLRVEHFSKVDKSMNWPTFNVLAKSRARKGF